VDDVIIQEGPDGLLLDEASDHFFARDVSDMKVHFLKAMDENFNSENMGPNDRQTQQTDKYYQPASAPVPKTYLVARSINDVSSMRILTVLFDSGSTGCWINARALPRGCEPTPLHEPKQSLTLAGSLSSTLFVQISGITLPELDRNKSIAEQGAYVFHGECNYDIILGRDFLDQIGLTIDFELAEIRWMGRSISMEGASTQQRTQTENSSLSEDADDNVQTYSFAAEITHAKYEEWTPAAVAAAQTHLTQSQRDDIEELVRKYSRLFSGKLGLYRGKPIHLEVDDGAIPVHARPYSIPHAHRDVFRDELRRLEDITVLHPCGATDWAAPTFIIPKKDGSVRVVTDFRELNKVLKRRIYPLPRIQDIMQRRTRYKFCTKLDLSMMFYAFVLDEQSRQLCTIITPFGKFQYGRLPMGIKCAPDIAQETIEEVLRDCDCENYIDDVGVFNDTWEQHLHLLDKILSRLQAAGFTINPLKCQWGVGSTRNRFFGILAHSRRH